MQPIALIDKANPKQQRAETQKAKDAVSLTELADVDEKDLSDSHCN